MAFAVRYKDNPTTLLDTRTSVEVRRELSAARMAALQNKTEAEMERRFRAGHRAYVGYVAGTAVSWGWVATRVAEIGEMNAAFSIPRRERYLWNFVTLKEYRGQGIYPQLLRAIVSAEWSEADRFWIAYAPENHASAAGIRRAGFHAVAELSFDKAGRAAVHEIAEGATMVARMLELPIVNDQLTPCWRCVRAGRGAMACAEGQCRCDYQRPENDCVA